MTTEKIIKLLEDEIENVQKGKTDNKKARAVADLSSQLIYAMRLDREDKKLEVEKGKLDLNKFSKGMK